MIEEIIAWCIFLSIITPVLIFGFLIDNKPELFPIWLHCLLDSKYYKEYQVDRLMKLIEMSAKFECEHKETIRLLKLNLKYNTK